MAKKVDILTIESRNLYVGAVDTFPYDLSELETALGETVSAVAWSTSDATVTVGSPSLTSSVTSCPITGVSKGKALIKLDITTTGSDAPDFYFIANVIEATS